MDRRIAEWLVSRDTGASSMTIMLWLSSGVRYGHANTPSDPSDLARCLRLLERIPEWKPRIGEMAEAGGMWPTFVRRWPEMEAAFIADCGGSLPEKGASWSCPQTYALMKAVEAESRQDRNQDDGAIDLGGGMSVRFGQ